MRRPLPLALILFAASILSAQGTETWVQSKFGDFQKGTTTGVAITSDGVLELAPQFKPLYTSPSAFLWGIASDAAGNVYAAAGAPARVYRIQPDGRAEIIFEPKEFQVQALVVRGETVYAATSPDGKIYKISRSAASAGASAAERQAGAAQAGATRVTASGWSASVFFDPHTKYIWALAMDAKGTLYAATGDQGQIFRVLPDGSGAVFFESADAHVRALAFDRQGNLIAGSDGSGLIYRIATSRIATSRIAPSRIAPNGDAFVLYSAPKKEITALAVDADGNIYAAGLGEKRANLPPAAIPAPPNVTPPAAGANPAAAVAIPAPPMVTPANAGGSEIYRIAPDGSPSTIWRSRDDLIYALAFARVEGTEQLVAGAGNKGSIYAIRDDGSFTSVAHASANQVTGFAGAPAGGLYACTSNLGKIFVLGAESERQGSFASDVFDARLFSRWGRMVVRGAGDYQLEARSGNVENPDRNWSRWSKVETRGAKADDIQAPPARFLQWKAVLTAGNTPPEIESVTANYLTKNVAPVVDSVEVQVPGAPGSESGSATPATSTAATANAATQSAPAAAAAPGARDRTVTIRWSAHDDNNDQIVYRLYYRGDDESNWKPLTRQLLTEKTYSFDPALLPDGGYRVKVVASDSPSHSPQDALTGERVSDRFEIDTTPPQVLDLHAAFESNSGEFNSGEPTSGESRERESTNGVGRGSGSGASPAALHVTFRALDGFSAIRRAEYSLDAGDWQFIAPVGELSDSKEEHYDFTIPLLAVAGKPSRTQNAETVNPTEHVLAVRAYDSFGNVGSAKVVIR